MAFVPRPRFVFNAAAGSLGNSAPSWFIGHMARGLRRIQETLPSIDLILEVRDARLPLTSINPAFEKLFGSDRGFHAKSGKKRLVVYNKRDLAEPALDRVRYTIGRLVTVVIDLRSNATLSICSQSKEPCCSMRGSFRSLLTAATIMMSADC